METLYKSKYYEILFDAANSLIVHKAFPETDRMSDEEFKQEMLIFLQMCEKYKPEKDLVDLINMGYAIVPDVQEWVNAEVFSKLIHIIKRMALIMPVGFFETVAVEQTMEEYFGQKFDKQYFKTATQAMEWLMQ